MLGVLTVKEGKKVSILSGGKNWEYQVFRELEKLMSYVSICFPEVDRKRFSYEIEFSKK